MSSKWMEAFSRAKAVEAEGDSYFRDFAPPKKSHKKRRREEIEVASEDEEDSDADSSRQQGKSSATTATASSTQKKTPRTGGFCQPSVLSQFAMEIKTSIASGVGLTPFQAGSMSTFIPKSGNPAESAAPGAVVTTSNSGNSQEAIATEASADNVPKQICRAWFKHRYLGSKAACADPVCRRKHAVDEKNPERLYKDYVFKGLPTAQRKRIMNEIKDEIENRQKT